MKGLHIVFEGTDGSGKSTQLKKLSKWMGDRAIFHMTTKEPGSPHIEECKKIKQLVLDPKNNYVPKAELLLFLADRAQHIEGFVKSYIEKGIHVLQDRFIYSTLIYQSARGLSRTKIESLLEFTTDGLKPDLTILLDIPADIGLTRAKNSNNIFEGGDRMERSGLKYYESVRQGFLQLAESVRYNNFQVVDASPPKNEEEIHKEIIEIVSKKLWAEEM